MNVFRRGLSYSGNLSLRSDLLNKPNSLLTLHSIRVPPYTPNNTTSILSKYTRKKLQTPFNSTINLSLIIIHMMWSSSSVSMPGQVYLLQRVNIIIWMEWVQTCFDVLLRTRCISWVTRPFYKQAQRIGYNRRRSEPLNRKEPQDNQVRMDLLSRRNTTQQAAPRRTINENSTSWRIVKCEIAPMLSHVDFRKTWNSPS